MRMQMLLAPILLLGVVDQGRAQYGPTNQGLGQNNNMPGYNRQVQPLSPYLNLLRGGNPAVNYYYGVQPAQQNPILFNNANQGYGPRLTFFPRLDLPEIEPGEERNAGIPPTGHGIGFNNTLGFFGARQSATSGPLANQGSNRRRPGQFGNR
jgi:hypothetical protein